MLSLKSAARRGGIASLAALSALALASCSAGQITQTSSKVAAVDGASADSEDGTVAVRDVTVVLDEENEASLKFTAINQDQSMAEHTLESVEVDGQEVTIEDNEPLQANCSMVAASEATIADLPKFEDGCITYTATSLDNEDFAIAGNLPVVFTFEHTTIEVDSTVSMVHPEAGEVHREDMTDTQTDNQPMFGDAADH